jgi:hypothetical protein
MMCQRCEHGGGVRRREFLALSGAAALAANWSARAGRADDEDVAAPTAARSKRPSRVRAVFLYPPMEVVNAGQMEDNWAAHHWATWPGNQYEPEAQERRFREKIAAIAADLGVEVTFAPRPIYQKETAEAFIAETKASGDDAVLVVNFWNTLSPLSLRIATESAPTAVVYHAVGANHQLPPETLRTAEGLYYIHSIENFEEIGRGLHAVRARVNLSQSRLLRVSDVTTPKGLEREASLGVEVVDAPAEEFNSLFDSIADDDALRREAMAFKARATTVTDVSDASFLDGVRAHRAVREMLARYQAEAITIKCLMLEHRKPCISFALNNGDLVPSGCENDLNASLTLMLGRWLLDRGGFQHNPEFDTSENRYFGAHCTCAPLLHGPRAGAQAFAVRPFFHQLPKTAALDVKWTPGETVLVAKYRAELRALSCWTGRVVDSPSSPPTGGCATRVLIDIDRVEDVCSIYSGPHPVLYCADRGEARRFKAFARMSRLKLDGNV